VVGADEAHAAGKAVAANVATCHLERIIGDVDGIHPRVRQRPRAGNGDAAGASAQIEHSPYLVRLDPGREAPLDELGDRRARDEHPRIDLDAHTGEPGDTGEVRRGDALADAAREELPYALLARAADAPAVQRGSQRVRQAEGMQHQRRGLIAGIVGTVAEEDTGARQASRAARDECPDGEGALPAPRAPAAP